MEGERIPWDSELLEAKLKMNRLEDRPDETKHVTPEFRYWLNKKLPGDEAREKLVLGKRPRYGAHLWLESEASQGRYIIDLVFWENHSAVVAEVETELNNSALGQALAYSHVYKDKKYNFNYEKGTRVIPAVVCCVAPKDYLDVAKTVGVRVCFCRMGLTKSIKGKRASVKVLQATPLPRGQLFGSFHGSKKM